MESSTSSKSTLQREGKETIAADVNSSPTENPSVSIENKQDEPSEAFYDDLFKDRYSEKDEDYMKTPLSSTPPCFPAFNKL